jgi:hypothetical protein
MLGAKQIKLEVGFQDTLSKELEYQIWQEFIDLEAYYGHGIYNTMAGSCSNKSYLLLSMFL